MTDREKVARRLCLTFWAVDAPNYKWDDVSMQDAWLAVADEVLKALTLPDVAMKWVGHYGEGDNGTWEISDADWLAHKAAVERLMKP